MAGRRSSRRTPGGRGLGRGTGRGALIGLAAAALFGASTPLAKSLLGEVRPQLLAGLLYAGAAMTLGARRAAGPTAGEARLGRGDLPRLAALTLAGGVAAPVLMLLGLDRVSGVAGSLLLNLEAPLTMLLALTVFGEHLDRRASAGAGLIVASAAALGLGGPGGRVDAVGLLLVAAACASWALDNNLTQRLSDRDPFQVTSVKVTVAAATNLALAFALGAPLPRLTAVAASLGLGAAAYGVSVVLDAYALRLVGAAREAAYFATAPFFGVAIAAAVLGEAVGRRELLAIAGMAAGVGLMVGERHGHPHLHPSLVHDHRHRHDDDHHAHVHGPSTGDDPLDPDGWHSHPHRHQPLRHAHDHVSDAHHRHPHG